MKHLTTTLVLMLSMLAVSGNASAMTIEEYKNAKNNKQEWPVTQIYLNGVGVGVSLAAAVLIQQGRPPLFCQPKEIDLNKENYIKLIDAFITKNEVEEAPIETILLMALVTAFPCA